MRCSLRHVRMTSVTVPLTITQSCGGDDSLSEGNRRTRRCVTVSHLATPCWNERRREMQSDLMRLAAIIPAASCQGRYISSSHFIFLSFIYLFDYFIEMGAGTVGGLQTACTDLRGGGEWTLRRDVCSAWNSHSMPLPPKVSLFFSIRGSFHNCAIISALTISMPSAKVTKSEAESLSSLRNLMESHTT